MTPDKAKRYLLDQANGLVPTLDQILIAHRNTAAPAINESGRVRQAIQNSKKNASGKAGKKMSIYNADHNIYQKTPQNL